MTKCHEVSETFECIHCKRPVVASRFAPHLEKCMGMGRVSSRLAARRAPPIPVVTVNNDGKQHESLSVDGGEATDDDNSDDSAFGERKPHKKMRHSQQSIMLLPSKKKGKRVAFTKTPFLAKFSVNFQTSE